MPENNRPKIASGKKIVVLGIIVVMLISSYVMVRIVQVSGPGPDPSTIPKRPGR